MKREGFRVPGRIVTVDSDVSVSQTALLEGPHNIHGNSRWVVVVVALYPADAQYRSIGTWHMWCNMFGHQCTWLANRIVHQYVCMFCVGPVGLPMAEYVPNTTLGEDKKEVQENLQNHPFANATHHFSKYTVHCPL